MFIQGIDYTQWHIAKQGVWNFSDTLKGNKQRFQ